MNWWEELILSAVVGIVKGAVKNPQKYAKLAHIFSELYNDLGIVVGALADGTGAPATPPPTATLAATAQQDTAAQSAPGSGHSTSDAELAK